MHQVFLAVVLACAVLLTRIEAVRPRACRNVGAICSSCTEVSLCTRRSGFATVKKCTHPNPYCDKGACTSKFPGVKRCGKKFDESITYDDRNYDDGPYDDRTSSKFTCPEEDGTYPDPNSCHAYHICLNGVDTRYECSVLGINTDHPAVYGDGTRSCHFWNNDWGTDCKTPRCEGADRYATIKDNNGHVVERQNYYFLCVNGYPSEVKRCPKDLVFDYDLRKCVFECPNNGHREDERRYVDHEGSGKTFIECTYSSASDVESVLRTCPSGSIFDEASLECVSERLVLPPAKTTSKPLKRFPTAGT